jgi:L-gulonolactone oxidase
MATGNDRRVWRNWSMTEECHPESWARPRTAYELAASIAEAGHAGQRVKAIGAGHSFTGVAVTEGRVVDLSEMTGIVAADETTGLVTVRAGTPLHELGPGLDLRGLALENLGDIDRQTIAGAISTGTHGTGARFGGLASQVRAVEMVLADGSVVEASSDERPELFQAARLGLGAVGVLTKVTVQCVPAFRLRAKEQPMALDEVLDGFDELADGNDHFELFWFPHTRTALTKRNTRLPGDAQLDPLGRIEGWVDDELLSNKVFEWTNRLATRAPRTIRGLNLIAARALGAREFVDASYKVFASPRRVVFREMEYAVPRQAAAETVREIRGWLKRSGERVAFPIEVRVAPADDVWLSTAYERDSAYIAVHQYHRRSHESYFDAVEAIAVAAGGRPHWGKLHSRTSEDLARCYPRFDDFTAVRRKVDPGGMFANAYLDRVLGPVLPGARPAPPSTRQ